ncbi:MAG: MraY family glycosyltransferase [Acidimicrobiales bacterium]
MIGVVVAAAIIWSVGFVDDVREITAPAKVAGMVLAGSVMSLTGVSILFFRVPFFDLLFLSADWSALITVLWVVGMANVVNLIDGLDGLAGGIVAIASGTFLLYAAAGQRGVIEPTNPGALWACITLGVCLGFLPTTCTGPDLHGRRGSAAARPADGCVDDVGGRADHGRVLRPVVLLLRSHLHSARHPRGTRLRHRLRHRPSRRSPQCRGRRRQGASPPPTHAAGPRTSPLGADPVGVDGVAVGLRAVPHLHRGGRRHRPDRGRRAGPRPVLGLPTPVPRSAVEVDEAELDALEEAERLRGSRRARRPAP